jgi:ATP-dependent Clp protease ATP-binding subunit ClpC
MTEKFTQKAQNALKFALTAAQEMGHSYIGSEHLLLGLASER